MNIHEGEGLPDFCMIDGCSDDAFMDNLQLRFGLDRIYTYIGEQVVSVNPFRNIPGLRGAETMDNYKNQYMYEVDPHVYALGDDTYRALMQTKNDQCVIITGESGAGKTEASKIFMEMLASVSRGDHDADSIKRKLLESNPVMEAFGNAKTHRNDNSSRFGKYLSITFDGAGAPNGGAIEQYLLEKSRVVTRADGERSFHVFYMLLSQTDLLYDLNLVNDPSAYNYLALSNCYMVDTIDDARDFAEVEQAMNTLGWSADDKNAVWRVLAAILHLGNLEYDVDEEQTTVEAVRVLNPDVVAVVADLLQVDINFLDLALTSRSIETGAGRRRSHISVPLNLIQAYETRDALAKGLYHKLFMSVVATINENLETTDNVANTIGVLDIYGFEIFEHNSFEQFCINYANEKLQSLFIENVLKQEQEEYAREGITWTPIDYFNNEPIVTLIEGRTAGVIAMLDEACLVGNATADSLMDKFDTSFGNHPNYESRKTTNDRDIDFNCFRVKHYAGDVTYEVDEFMDKNVDTLFHDLVAAMQTSTLALLARMFPVSNSTKSKKRPVTAGTQFRTALNELIATLNRCQPHYIRCIKPNDQKRAGVFDEERIRHQVTYLNLVETVRVRRAGFCNRQPYERFLARYRMLSDETWPLFYGSARSGVEAIIASLGIERGEYELGHSKLFIKNANTLSTFEEVRAQEMPKVVIPIQAHWRGYKTRQWFKIAIEELRRERAALAAKLRLVAMANRIATQWKIWKRRRIRACNDIGVCYVNHKLRTYIEGVTDCFEGVGNDDRGPLNRWGRGRVPPQPWRRLRELGAPAMIDAVHVYWWADKMVMSLNDTEQRLMRQKVLAMDLVSGNKPWDPARDFEADYLDSPGNPRQEKYTEAIQNLFQAGGDSRIYFSDDVAKINKKGKSQVRTLIVSDRHVYKYEPKKYVVRKSGIPLTAVASVSVSPNPDTFVCIHMNAPHRDMLLDLGTHDAERVSELITVLFEVMRDEYDRELQINFLNTFSFNNNRVEDPKVPGTLKSSGVDVELAFAISPKANATACSYSKGKNNTATIFYPEP